MNEINELAELNGLEVVKNLVIEECSELIKEMTKVNRGIGNATNIKEGIADVILVIYQLMYLLDISDEDIGKIAGKKVERTMKRYYE